MKLINFLNDEIVSKNDGSTLEGWNVREAVRAVLFNERNQVAVMHIGQRDIYKLPGGGMENGEDLKMAFVREMLEETGCEAEIKNDVGIFIEKRDEWKMFQISHCYIAKATKVGTLMLDAGEQKEQFSLQWVDSIEEAMDRIKSNQPGNYDDRYMTIRDLKILELAKNLSL